MNRRFRAKSRSEWLRNGRTENTQMRVQRSHNESWELSYNRSFSGPPRPRPEAALLERQARQPGRQTEGEKAVFWKMRGQDRKRRELEIAEGSAAASHLRPGGTVTPRHTTPTVTPQTLVPPAPLPPAHHRSSAALGNSLSSGCNVQLFFSMNNK